MYAPLGEWTLLGPDRGLNRVGLLGCRQHLVKMANPDLVDWALMRHDIHDEVVCL